MENQKLTCLILLDLGVAFGNVSYSLLPYRLKFRFGLGGTITEWLKSYLAGCTQQVALHNALSDPAVLEEGVPQGSVLGPLLFSLYISPLGDICRRHNVEFHPYADDEQNIFSFEPRPSIKSGIKTLQECIWDICIWIHTNLLKLNDEKTEFHLIGTRQQLAKVGDIFMEIGSNVIWPAGQVRNLGVYWKNLITTTAHFNKLCGQLSCTINTIACKHNLLDSDTTKIVMQSLVFSILDYCNSQLAGSYRKDMKNLQHTQNMVCRVIFNLISLHWLKVEYRVIFKLAILIYKCIEGTVPWYLIEMVVKCRNTRVLQSSTVNKLLTTKNNLTQVKLSSFTLIGPHIWNNLLPNITNAKSVITFENNMSKHSCLHNAIINHVYLKLKW